MTPDESAARDAVVAAAEKPRTMGLEGMAHTTRVNSAWLNELLDALDKLHASRVPKPRYRVRLHEGFFFVSDGDVTWCRCYSEERAERIARALNAAEQEKA